MHSWYSNFKDKIRTLAQGDDAVANALKLVFSIFGNAYIQAAISIILPFILAILTNLATSSPTIVVIMPDTQDGILDQPVPLAPAPINTQKYWSWLIILVLIYLILQAFMLIANQHHLSKLNDVQWFQSALNSHAYVNATIAKSICLFTNRFAQQRDIGYKIPIEATKDLVGFQTFAFCVCEDIYKIVKDLFGCNKPQVTVFRRFDEGGEKYIQMIAYGTYNNLPPSSHSEKYNLSNEDKLNRYDIQIFNGKEAKIHVLPDKVTVQKNFYISDYSKEREEAICQYIGVPIKNNNGDIIFLLQIDVDVERKSKKELKELGENVFFPFALLLYNTYEHERMLETLHPSINVSKNPEIEYPRKLFEGKVTKGLGRR